ncbi:MAG: RdgB/HAM1 family non-canonical purine NTP pyrophosphatase [Actinomycetales bacterium]|nr:RdgB/HAM1 family non-canonical purine NTP pyrophosphatase [Actinomycetales bacterium]
MDSSPFKIVIASKNLGKIAEFKRILGEVGISIITDIEFPDVDESGSTFEENALLKAHAISRYTNLPALADDSGLAVDYLGGAPGIFSARWSGVHGDDGANIKRLLEDLNGVSLENRGAKFIAVLALVRPDGEELLVRGELRGKIRNQPVGVNGFGYDPIFEPENSDRTLGEMSAAEKDAISHRSKALTELTPRIRPFLSRR